MVMSVLVSEFIYVWEGPCDISLSSYLVICQLSINIYLSSFPSFLNCFRLFSSVSSKIDLL